MRNATVWAMAVAKAEKLVRERNALMHQTARVLGWANPQTRSLEVAYERAVQVRRSAEALAFGW